MRYFALYSEEIIVRMVLSIVTCTLNSTDANLIDDVKHEHVHLMPTRRQLEFVGCKPNPNNPGAFVDTRDGK
jgi:hypothetical protein